MRTQNQIKGRETVMKKGISHYRVGESFNHFLLLKNVSRGVASNGKPFLTLILCDSTGEIEAKLWDASKEDEATFVPEEIVRIAGEITEFRGQLQLKINSIRPQQPTDGVHVSNFVQKAPVDKEILIERITDSIFEIKNPKIQRIVRALIKKYEEDLFVYPAAVTNHHAYVSGLAHHIASMLSLAGKLTALYPQLNKDLLYAGVILHDLGKIDELSGIVTTSYTLEGQLLGHIPIMIEEIGHIAKELQIEGEEVLILKHLVLSHHQKAEWGSPKPPLIQEAEMLHYIDMIDARMNTLEQSLKKIQPGEFTERIFALDNRSFYKPKFEEH